MGLVLRALIAGVLAFGYAVASQPAAAQTVFSTEPIALAVPAAASVTAN